MSIELKQLKAMLQPYLVNADNMNEVLHGLMRERALLLMLKNENGLYGLTPIEVDRFDTDHDYQGRSMFDLPSFLNCKIAQSVIRFTDLEQKEYFLTSLYERYYNSDELLSTKVLKFDGINEEMRDAFYMQCRVDWWDYGQVSGMESLNYLNYSIDIARARCLETPKSISIFIKIIDAFLS